jgi:hypothetical protein
MMLGGAVSGDASSRIVLYKTELFNNTCIGMFDQEMTLISLPAL